MVRFLAVLVAPIAELEAWCTVGDKKSKGSFGEGGRGERSVFTSESLKGRLRGGDWRRAWSIERGVAGLESEEDIEVVVRRGVFSMMELICIKIKRLISAA